MNLDKLAFVDIETSGSSTTHDRIIEIGILRVENQELVRTYETLINPQTVVSPFIEEMTGIQSADLVTAPTFEEIKDEILEVLDSCVFVAHNVRFDYGFLKNEFRRYGVSFAPKHFCTVKLSRTLYPQHTKHNLDALMERFELSCDRRHRAFDDAKVIWDFYQRLHQDIPTDKLTDALKMALRKPSLPIHLPPNTLDTIPENPGVYIFYGENNMPLYIGKSINLRDRVASHFSGDHSSAKEMNISQQLRSIETISTAGELGALLKEATLVKQMMPLYNRHLRNAKKLTIARKTKTKEGYDTIKLEDVSTIGIDDIEDIVAIFRTKQQAKEKLADIANKYALCEKILGIEKGKGSCFGYKIEQCHGACIGEELPIKYNLRFTEAFYNLKIKSWPFPGPIMIEEYDAVEQRREVFVIDKWCLINGTINTEPLEDMNQETFTKSVLNSLNREDIIFDYDTYKILVRYLFDKRNQQSIKVLSREAKE